MGVHPPREGRGATGGPGEAGPGSNASFSMDHSCS